VSALTQAVFDQVPGARSLDLWRQLERLDGPALISIPAPVRTEMLRQATGTLAAATMAASASYSLVGADVRKDRPTHGVARPESEAYRRTRIGPRPISPIGWWRSCSLVTARIRTFVRIGLIWEAGPSRLWGDLSEVVRVSGTATCFGVREGSRVVADPVGIRVVGGACSSAADTLRGRWGSSGDRLVLGEQLIRLGGACRLRWWEWRLARRATASRKASAGLAAGSQATHDRPRFWRSRMPPTAPTRAVGRRLAPWRVVSKGSWRAAPSGAYGSEVAGPTCTW